jgi:hypothetical protein
MRTTTLRLSVVFCSVRSLTSFGLTTAFAVSVALFVVGPGALPAAEKTPKRPEPFELGYLAPIAKGFLACRPSVWFKQPGMEKASAKLDQGIAALKSVGITWRKELRPEHIEQIVADVNIQVRKDAAKPGSQTLMIGASNIFIRMDHDFDWLACFDTMLSELKRLLAGQDDLCKKCFANTGRMTVEGVTVYRLGVVPILGGMTLCAHMPDRRSVVLSCLPPKNSETELVRLLRGAPAARKRHWGSGLSKIEDAALAVVLDNHDNYYAKTYLKDLEKKDVQVLKRIRFAAVGIELGEGKPVRAVMDAKSADAAPVLEKAIYRYGRRALSTIREAPKDNEADRVWMKLLTELVKSGRVHRDGDRVEWLGFSSIVLHDLIDAMPGAGPCRKTVDGN